MSAPATKVETKNEAFLRLAQKRLHAAREDMRLISQLASRNYEYTSLQAEEVIRVLDDSLRFVAQSLGVPISTVIGEGAARAEKTGHLVTSASDARINEMDIANAIDAIKAGKNAEAIDTLRKALMGLKR